MNDDFSLESEVPEKPAVEPVKDRQVYEALMTFRDLLGTERDVIERYLAGDLQTPISMKRLEQIKQAHMRQLIEAKAI